MIANIQSGGGSPISDFPQGNAMRVGYNPSTKSFKPLFASAPKKMEHLVKVESQVNQLPIPIDCTSPKVLKQQIVSKNTHRGEKLDSTTKGVSEFLTGSPVYFLPLFHSVRTALRAL